MEIKKYILETSTAPACHNKFTHTCDSCNSVFARPPAQDYCPICKAYNIVPFDLEEYTQQPEPKPSESQIDKELERIILTEIDPYRQLSMVRELLKAFISEPEPKPSEVKKVPTVKDINDAWSDHSYTDMFYTQRMVKPDFFKAIQALIGEGETAKERYDKAMKYFTETVMKVYTSPVGFIEPIIQMASGHIPKKGAEG